MSYRGEVEARDHTMVIRDSSITTLQKQSLGVVDKLKVCGLKIMEMLYIYMYMYMAVLC